MSFTNYWVFDWLRENHISSVEEAAAFLPRYRVLNTLRNRADQASNQRREPIPQDQVSIVAGTGVDLSGGRMVCPGPSCLRLQVDNLLKHIWHYFDFVLVDDVLTPLLTEEWHGSKKDLIGEILSQLAPVLYLDQIGAAGLVEFRSKNHCAEHWEQHARDEGLDAILDSRDQLMTELSQNSTFSRTTKGGQQVYEIQCDDAGVSVCIPTKAGNERQAQAFLVM